MPVITHIAFTQLQITHWATWQNLLLEGRPIDIVAMGGWEAVKSAIFRDYYGPGKERQRVLLAEVVERPEEATHLIVKGAAYQQPAMYGIDEINKVNQEHERFYVRAFHYDLTAILYRKSIRE